MGRRPRDRERDAAAIAAAAQRLLAGTPLRSASGRLTATELIVESGLRRDVVYPLHQDLVDQFRLQVKAQGHVAAAAQDLAERHEEALAQLAKAKQQLERERELTAFLRRVVAELSVELENIRREQQAIAEETVVPFPGAHRARRPPSGQ